MHELVTRIQLVADACNGKLNLTLPYAREYCYLQFRRMCELVALGCLQLHGDIPAVRTNALKKEWNADKIMQRLHKSHPHAFPQSVVRTLENGIWHFEGNSLPNALTLKEFKALYQECGGVLHRGTIKSIEAEGPLAQEDFEKVVRWQNKVVDLMNQHIIARKTDKGMYLISLKSENGLPACSVFSKWGDGTVEVANYNLRLSGQGGIEDG